MKRIFLTHLSLLLFFCIAYAQEPETLGTVSNRGNIATTSLIIDPLADAFRSFIVKRLNSTTTTTSQVAIANNKTYGAITWHPDLSTITTQYALNIGANVLNYYNNGTTETVWRSGNFNPSSYLALTGGNITGDITIGTTALQKQLNVNGNIKARKVKVTVTEWPDYVFETSYPLPPLSFVAQFIQQNKHLPGMPAATTVAKEGIDLGSNQVVLLKKIEELTLYIIAQDKKQEILDKKNIALENRLAEIENILGTQINR
ncbi:hypothetical protein [Chitinophaga defluvii]|uniref:Endosialidase-like protein n=1 Tax=Chitinophaga defluvii TaxID=3163343 RepID=A0ABV2TBJ6_9BACT